MRASLPRLPFAAVVLALAMAARAAFAAPRIDEVEDALAHDRSYKVRVEAALVLGRLRQSRSVPALIGALRDPNPAVRATAARSLGQIGSPIAKDAVAKALVDPVPLVRRMAKDAMKQLGGEDADTETPPPPVPGAPAIRARPGKKLSFEVKAMGDQSKHAGNALRSHMRDFVVAQLRPYGDVEPHEHEGMYAVDGVIKDLQTSTQGAEVEVTCAVQLVLSRQPGGGVFLLTSGEATVQRPKHHFKPQQRSGMEMEALENALRSASEDLLGQIARQ
ncbi:MAG TPA: HEAT repeat domain-containing protein [Polyangia bacterium]|nr:HEAT repeat domain-containing protein [Polyangia bacterium]